MYEKFHAIIKEICAEEKIKMTLLSKGWITMLEKKGSIKLITGHKFDLNSQALSYILDDKYATYELLKSLNIPVACHKIIFKEDNDNSFAKDSNSYQVVENYFYKNNENIVIKANNGTCGKEVYHVTNVEDLKIYLEKLFLNNYSISICPYYEILTEYRLVMLKKEVKLLYAKIKPVVIGDGKSTLKELLLNFNFNYFTNQKNLEKVSENFILKKGGKFEYNWQFNLSKGASLSLNIPNAIKNKLILLAIETANKIGLEFGSIDIVETKIIN